MKTRIIIISAAVAFIAIVIAIFALKPYIFPEDFEKTINVDFSTVDKVVIASGSTGKYCTIEGKEDLQAFFNMFKGIKLRKDFNQKQKTGIILSVTLIKSGNILVQFEFGYDHVTVDNNDKLTKYISNKNIDHEQIKKIASTYNID